MDDNKIFVAGIFLFMILGFLTLFQFGGVLNPAPPPEPGAATEAVSPTPGEAKIFHPRNDGCGKAAQTCIAVAEVNSDNCDLNSAHTRLTGMLANPLQLQGCDKVEAALATECGAECKPNFATLFVVPGKIEYLPEMPGAIETNSCVVRASRPVSVTVDCQLP